MDIAEKELSGLDYETDNDAVKNDKKMDWTQYIDKGFDVVGKYFDSKRAGDVYNNYEQKDNTIIYVLGIGLIAIFIFKKL